MYKELGLGWRVHQLVENGYVTIYRVYDKKFKDINLSIKSSSNAIRYDLFIMDALASRGLIDKLKYLYSEKYIFGM